MEDELAEISENFEKRNEVQTSLTGKQEFTIIQVQKARDALNELLTISTDQLSNIEETEAGGPAETLNLLVSYLSDVVTSQELALPGIPDMEKLPAVVKTKYEQVDVFLTLANQANTEEQNESSNYDELRQGVEDYVIEEQYRTKGEKLRAIKEAEAIAGAIIEAGTLWKYEGRLTLGENIKGKMPREIANQLIEKLTEHMDELDAASLEDDIQRLQEGLVYAKEVVHDLEQNLVAYDYVERVDKVIREVVQTIEISESQVNRLKRKSTMP